MRRRVGGEQGVHQRLALVGHEPSQRGRELRRHLVAEHLGIQPEVDRLFHVLAFLRLALRVQRADREGQLGQGVRPGGGVHGLKRRHLGSQRAPGPSTRHHGLDAHHFGAGFALVRFQHTARGRHRLHEDLAMGSEMRRVGLERLGRHLAHEEADDDRLVRDVAIALHGIGERRHVAEKTLEVARREPRHRLGRQVRDRVRPPVRRQVELSAQFVGSLVEDVCGMRRPARPGRQVGPQRSQRHGGARVEADGPVDRPERLRQRARGHLRVDVVAERPARRAQRQQGAQVALQLGVDQVPQFHRKGRQRGVRRARPRHRQRPGRGHRSKPAGAPPDGHAGEGLKRGRVAGVGQFLRARAGERSRRGLGLPDRQGVRARTGDRAVGRESRHAGSHSLSP